MALAGGVDGEASDDGGLVQDRDVVVVADNGDGGSGPLVSEAVDVLVAEVYASSGADGPVEVPHGGGTRPGLRRDLAGGGIPLGGSGSVEALVGTVGVEQDVVGVQEPLELNKVRGRWVRC